jgi:peptide-methionine (S)-S-oxide reductase
METAVFGAGCFWGVEENFRVLPGVSKTEVGYCGGATDAPTYEAVCTDLTGHAEVVRVTFDPAIISYEKLLDVFWNNHNPTLVNRQGPDRGSQYRSIIVTQSPEQRRIAEASEAALQSTGMWKSPIATQIIDSVPFYRAEEYHQQYLFKRGASSCHL